MQANRDLNFDTPSGADFLPDFCSGPAVFAVLFITELVAMLLTLASVEAGPGLWHGLLWLSIYLQWIGLCSAAGLCLLRRRIHHLPGLRVALLAYVLLLGITCLIAQASYLVSTNYNLPLAFTMSLSEFLVRSMGVSAVVSALALRYFWLQHQWRRGILATGKAEYELLQARIRPHFLFNSLNSIAELTASQPRAAETAVEDLATLFRANLSQPNQQVTLAEELELCRAYLRMEALRLGERLQVNWDIDIPSEQVHLPPLILQPLIENAVRHGIECLAEGGCISVKTRLTDKVLDICITNPTGDLKKPGTGEALSNTEQRLLWLYGDQAYLRTHAGSDEFQVDLRLPVETPVI